MRAREQTQLEYRTADVSDELGDMQTLGDVCRIHRGVEVALPLQVNGAKLLSEQRQNGFMPGVFKKDHLKHAFQVCSTAWINMSPDVIRPGAEELPWDRPKIIVRKQDAGRNPWNLVAAVDDSALVCYRNFYCLWPTEEWTRECLAAVLNAPVANEHVGYVSHNSDDLVSGRILGNIPIPALDTQQREQLTYCVRQYIGAVETSSPEQSHAQMKESLQQIDSIVLDGYGLTPRLERKLLDSFAGHQRPVPFEFTRFYEEGFRAAVPYSTYVSTDFQKSTGRQVGQRMPVIEDEGIHAAMQTLRRLAVEGEETEHE